MANTKKYTSVSEMFARHATSEESNDLNQMVASKKLSKQLFSLRCMADMTQAELAKKSGMSQSKISKIEHSDDRDLSIGDILDYCKALDFHLNIGIMPAGMKLPNLVKFHWFETQKHLRKILELSDGDEEMEKAAQSFMLEAAYNINNGLMACLDRFMPKQVDEDPLHVLTPSEYRMAPVDITTCHTP